MQILSAFLLLVCAVSSLIFLFQILGGFAGVFWARYEGVSKNWGISLMIAVLTGVGFAYAASGVYDEGHPTTENKQE